MITQPMLAGKIPDVTKLRFPLLATPKLDGIRALMVDGKLLSRSFKPIPNKYIREVLEDILPNGIDGEIMLRNPGSTFQQISSAVMSRDGEPDFVFYAFDYVEADLELPYSFRIGRLRRWYSAGDDGSCVDLVLPELLPHHVALEQYEALVLEAGYEGVMLRDPQGVYKCGCSTFKEHGLLKLKRFEQSEAIITGFLEEMHNKNPKEKDNFGRTKRGKKKEFLVPANTLGKLRVRDIKTKAEFKVGTGFDQELRKEIWLNRRKYKGKIVTYTYQKHGMKGDVPRSPVFKGFRSTEDM